MTMKLAWCTDTHLDFCSLEHKKKFYNLLDTVDSDVVGITGDISTGTEIIETLKSLMYYQSKPVWFVLGNHDYYHSSIVTVRKEIQELCKQYENLIWLDKAEPILISDEVALLGHSGWGDAKNGDFLRTPVRLNDHRLIKELSHLERRSLQTKLMLLGSEAGFHLENGFTSLPSSIKTVWVLTHVPPFPESAWYGEESGHWDWIPDFTCKSIGDVLLKQAEQNPQLQINVLCGHGHSKGQVWMRDNLFVRTGEAEYKKPKIIDVIELS